MVGYQQQQVFRCDKNMPGKNLQQSIYNYKNLFKLMGITPKVLNCRVNMTYFVKNHDILFNYFQENEEQTSWKHNVYCDCETLTHTLRNILRHPKAMLNKYFQIYKK